MATGDITYDSTIGRSGNRNVYTGTIELTNSATDIAVFGTGTRIVDALFTCEDEAVGTFAVQINKNAAGTAVNGTINGIADGSGTVLRYRIESV